MLPTQIAIKSLTGLKEIFKIPQHTIKEGNKADLSLFNPKKEWVFSEKNITSTSDNAALLGCNLKGIVYGIIANNNIVLNK